MLGFYIIYLKIKHKNVWDFLDNKTFVNYEKDAMSVGLMPYNLQILLGSLPGIFIPWADIGVLGDI